MKIKISEAEGQVLDYLVAKAEGINYEVIDGGLDWHCPDYSTIWTDGGPIIEREGIALGQTADGWEATCDGAIYIYGKTPLIAAMRCYVASKLGEEVEVPDEIVS